MTLIIEVSDRSPYQEVDRYEVRTLADCPIAGDVVYVKKGEFTATVHRRIIDYKTDTVQLKARMD